MGIIRLARTPFGARPVTHRVADISR